MPTDFDISQTDPVSSIPVGAKVLYFSTDTGWGCVLAEDLLQVAVGDVEGLQAALDAKAAASHTHIIGNVTGLQAALDAKAAASHTHIIDNVTGLQAALDAKASTSHTQAISTVTGLQAALDAKASTSHTQAISTVTGLQAELDSRIYTNSQDEVDPTENAVVGRILVRVGATTLGYISVYEAPPAVAVVSLSGTGSPLTLDGTASTNAVSYAWTQSANPSQALSGLPASTASVEITFPGNGYVSGVYSFTLTVGNVLGNDSETTVKGWWDNDGGTFNTNPPSVQVASASSGGVDTVNFTAATTLGGSTSIDVGIFSDGSTLTPISETSVSIASPSSSFTGLSPSQTVFLRQRSVDSVGAKTDWSSTPISATTDGE